MKLKKILALVASVAIAASSFVSTTMVANAAEATARLEFDRYETVGTTLFAYVNVYASIPDTLVPYEVEYADWENTFYDEYSGKMLQSVGFDIPHVTGLSYIANKSSIAEYLQFKNNTTDKKWTIYTLNTGSYESYYAGEINKIATLCFRITGDKEAAYDVALSSAKIGIVEISSEYDADQDINVAKGTPIEYVITDITNAVIKPEEPAGPTTDVVGTTKKDNAVAGADEVYIEDSEAAVAYISDEYDFKSGQTAFWSAKFGGADKKKDINIANISGPAKLGIVIVGVADVSEVKLNVVTPAAN